MDGFDESRIVPQPLITAGTSPTFVSAADLRRKITSIYVEHPAFARVKKHLEFVTSLRPAEATMGERDEMPGTLVVAYSGAGKTTLLNRIQQHVGPSVRDALTVTGSRYAITAKADYVPLVYVVMPTEPSVKAVARFILKALGDPAYDKNRTNSQLTDKVVLYLRSCGCRALLIDEAHHAVDRTGTAFAEELADWLKIILDASGVPQVLLGLHRLEHFLVHNEQLRRRYTRVLELGPYRCFGENSAKKVEADEKALTDFAGTLLALFSQLPIPFDLDFENEFTLRRFYYATGGLIGYVKELCRTTVEIMALEGGGLVPIDLNWLARGYHEAATGKRLFAYAAHRHNPFTPEYAGELPPPIRTDSLYGMNRQKKRGLKQKELRAFANSALSK